MGIGIFGALHIGKEAMFTYQSSVGITGHNIANADTPGYSRQSPVVETMPPQIIGGIYFGRGSHLQTITKSYDKFLNKTIALETSILGRWQAQETYMKQAEAIFNESNGLGLNNMLNEFWDSWNDLAGHPEGIPERAFLQSTGQAIAQKFQNMALDLEKVRSDANDRLLRTVYQVNQLVSEIAGLNGKISSNQSQGLNANDLTDQRTLKIEKLSDLIDVTVIEDGNGQVTILTGSGKPMVADGISWQLSVKADVDRDGLYAVLHDSSGVAADITDKIRGGSLKGLIDVRDNIIPRYLDNLDQLAASFVTEVNRVHYQGYGLDGTTANYFFNSIDVWHQADGENVGGAKIYDAQVVDPAQLLGSDFELKFISSSPQTSKYEIYDTIGEEYVYRIDAGNSMLVFDDGGGDVVVDIAHGTYTGEELALELEKQFDAHASTNQDYTLTYDKTDRKFTIINKGTSSIDIKWEDSLTTAAEILGFDQSDKAAIASNASVESDSTGGTYTYGAQLFEIKNGANDSIVFNDGAPTDSTAKLTAGVYTASQLAAEIEKQLEAETGTAQTYSVSFDSDAQKYTITNDATNGNALQLKWTLSNTASTLGFDAIDSNVVTGASDESDNARYVERIFQITGGNNGIVFNDLGTGGNVTALLTEGTYTGEMLAAEIEKQLETAAGSSGQDYIVSFDSREGRFTIINADDNSHNLNLLWSASSAAAEIGFNAVDSGAFGVGFSDVSDNVAGRVVTYDSIEFYGMSVKITDETALPQTQDIFSIGIVNDAAKTIAMDAVTMSDPEKLAAAQNVFNIDGLNNTIVFDDDGDLSDGTNYKIIIPNGSYSPHELAEKIEQQLEQNGSGQSYAVNYDAATKKFTIASNPSNTQALVMLWENEETNASFNLGFRDEIFNISAGTNNEIQFDEGGGDLLATISSGSYTGNELAEEIQSQLRAAGSQEYNVTYDETTREFSIENPSEATAALSIHWNTYAASNATATTLGFNYAAGDDTVIAGNSAVSDFAPGSIFPDGTYESEFETGGAEVGDNRNALKLADLRSLSVINNDTLTIDSFFNIIVGEVGTDVGSTESNITYQGFVMEQFEQRRQSIAGVSIDEEMVNLIKYQQAFAASAKYIGTLDQMLNQLLSIKL